MIFLLNGRNRKNVPVLYGHCHESIKLDIIGTDVKHVELFFKVECSLNCRCSLCFKFENKSMCSNDTKDHHCQAIPIRSKFIAVFSD